MRLVLLKPVSISINTFGTGTVPEEELIAAVRENFDLRPAGIIEMLDLRRPIYKQTAAYGHFGRTDVDLPWEHTDKVDAFESKFSKISYIQLERSPSGGCSSFFYGS